MRLLGSLTAVPLIFSVFVVGEHGYICSDAEHVTNTFYNQALVEKSVTNARVRGSELSAAKLAANVEAKKYPQVWVDSEDYGFNETVLLWKYQGNSPESLEESNVFVFTNNSCDILGLLQKSGDKYTICKSVKNQNDKKTSSEILSKKPRPGIFSGGSGYYDNYAARGNRADDAITIPQNSNGAYGYVQQNSNPYPASGQYPQQGYGAPSSGGCPPGGCPSGGCPPTNYPATNYQYSGCPPGGCPRGGFPPGGCPSGGCPPTNYPATNYQYSGCPPGGCRR
ncbi:unnamed protein product [Blumeria hordei]|uniref:Candidate secreted effector protein n=1 Tax=Blumeria hordei TaxID=2867405 RepID=A0A383UWH9_BLUHO|nr:unnamed protein product [Blumeria hordei]